MTSESAPEPEQGHAPPTDKPRKWGIRSIAAVVCFALAALLFPVSVVSFWGQRTLTDTERFVQTFGPLPAQPAIKQAIATQVSDALIETLDLEKIITDNLGPKASVIAGPLSMALEDFVYKITMKVLDSEQFQQLWNEAIRKLQEATISALSGDRGGAVQIEGDDLVLDLSSVVTKVKEALVARGITAAENVQIPAADQQIVLMDATQLKQAQMIYGFSVPIARWLIVIAAVLFIAAIALARRRIRMVIAVGVAALATAALLQIALWTGASFLTSSFAGTPWAAAGAVFFYTLTGYLGSAVAWIFVIGLLIVIVASFFSSNRYAVRLRARVLRT